MKQWSCCLCCARSLRRLRARIYHPRRGNEIIRTGICLTTGPAVVVGGSDVIKGHCSTRSDRRHYTRIVSEVTNAIKRNAVVVAGDRLAVDERGRRRARSRRSAGSARLGHCRGGCTARRKAGGRRGKADRVLQSQYGGYAATCRVIDHPEPGSESGRANGNPASGGDRSGAP
jgi:hypothetical protein